MKRANQVVDNQHRNGSAMYATILLALGLGIGSGAALAQSKRTYTLNADFDVINAAKFNVDHAPTTTINDGLELTAVGTTFPVLWIANAGEDTVSKIDTNTGTEVARYRTWFGPAGQPGHQPHLNNPFASAAPSRTAVDRDGNAYVLNRHFDGRRAMVMKILNAGGIDRNTNGTIDTSTSAATIKPLADNASGVANGQIDVSELQDERVAWVSYVDVANGLGRSLCISPDGNLWVGLFNVRRYFKISSTDGSILAGPVGVDHNPYGCVIDADGNLWSASLNNVMGKITNAHLNAGHVSSTINHAAACNQNYGIALGTGKVYLACIGQAVGYISCDKASGICTRPPTAPAAVTTGISVDANGDIWTSQYLSGGVFKNRGSDNAPMCSNAAGAGTENRGVIIDSNNDAWQVGVNSDLIKRFRGSDCAAVGSVTVGDAPYVYSDASGLSALTVTSPTGTWTVTQDAGAAAAYWGTINWNAIVPAGSSVTVRAQASDNPADLAGPPANPVTNGANFTAFGRFIKVEARLTANATRVSPQLLDVTIATRTCDVDRDGDIDRNDITLIANAAKVNQTAAPADTRDPDGDGVITVRDVRACTLRCTKPQCAP